MVGGIMQDKINSMMEAQNYFFGNQRNFAITGFVNITHHVPDLDIPLMEAKDEILDGFDLLTVPINIWMLHKRALDGDKLVTSIEIGPRGVYYFCTAEIHVPKMMEYIDSLDSTMGTHFDYKEY
eukprot:11710685-Ditylum_brightwellii.AAC.1